jgi:hypothetical protein
MVQHALDRGYEVVGVCGEESVAKLDGSTDVSPSFRERRTTPRSSRGRSQDATGYSSY